MSKCNALSAVELGDEPQHDDAADLHNTEDYGDAVEVTLRDAGGAQIRGDAAAEHVGEAPTATAVEQDEERQQQTRDAENDLQHYLENFHGEPFESLS